MKRAFIVHGWGGHPEEAWMPWLKTELEKLGVQVYALSMPDTDHPRIETWVPYLAENVGTPDSETYLVGHSIGCQTIIRYLETINTPIGGALFVAGWFTLMNSTPDEIPIREPWITTPINFAKVKINSPKMSAILSDDDDVVPLEENRKLFQENLGVQAFVEHGKGHFSGGDNITELPLALEELKKMMV